MRILGTSNGRSVSPLSAEIALWVSDNSLFSYGGNGGCNIAGYSAAQIAASYAGQPARSLDFGQLTEVGIAHGMGVLSDGALVLAHAEETNPNANEGFFLAEVAQIQVSADFSDFASPPIRSFLCGTFANTLAISGARACLQLADGSIMIGHGAWFARLTRNELAGVASHAGAALFASSAAFACWDLQQNAAGDVWIAGGNELQLVPLAMMPPVGVPSGATSFITPLKRLKGTNVAAANYQIYSVALDAAGGIWTCTSHDTQLGGESLRYWDSTAIAALTGSVSNPAPTRTLTSTAFQNIVTLNLDAAGGAWVVDFQANSLFHFSAAQLAAGGAQLPDRTITLFIPCPAFVRFAPGVGLFDR